MMTPDFRSLCAELLNGLDEIAHSRYPFPGYTRCAMDRARAALSEPEPVAPTLTEQALIALHAVATGANDTREQHQDLETIRRALEALP